jgi:hypothetical protein
MDINEGGWGGLEREYGKLINIKEEVVLRR